ncbi:MAG: hypothetical protein RR569_07745 [Acinetobacter sp.]
MKNKILVSLSYTIIVILTFYCIGHQHSLYKVYTDLMLSNISVSKAFNSLVLLSIFSVFILFMITILIILFIGKKSFNWLLGVPIIFLSLSNVHAKNLSNCIKSNKNKICIGEAENSYRESVYHLYVNNRKYPEISYYDNATIHKVDSKRFKIVSSFSSQGNTGITTTLSLKNGKPFIERINTVI